jgi:hypothetical protein
MKNDSTMTGFPMGQQGTKTAGGKPKMIDPKPGGTKTMPIKGAGGYKQGGSR